MKLKDFLTHCNQPGRSNSEELNVVVVLSQGGVGGTPCTEVTNVSTGFDWDNGKLMLRTKDPVITAEELKRIQKHARAFEKLLAAYAHENELEYMGQKLPQSMYPKGTTARMMKELLKANVDDYLNPALPKALNESTG